ncbi:hypothetical protein Hanom_Chr04g00350991 [Helianthus anomalus]
MITFFFGIFNVYNHRTATRLCDLGYDKEKQTEEFKGAVWSSRQGAGDTFFEKPETLEHTQDELELEVAGFNANETLERQIEVNGDSRIP